MDARLTDEQRALMSTTRAMLSRIPPSGSPLEQWQAVTGLAGLGIPENLGGDGGSAIEQAVVAEEAGKVLLGAPLVTTYAALGALSNDPGASTIVASLISSGLPTLLIEPGNGPAQNTSGTTALCTTDQADLLPESQVLVPVTGHDASVELHLLLGSDISTTVTSTLDASRPRRSARAQQVPSRVICSVHPSLLRSARRHHQVLLAADAVGVGQACLDLAIGHVSAREAFGRPIATYQAVAFPLADAYSDLALARALVQRAAWALQNDPGNRDAMAAGALAMAGDAAVLTAERAIQVHGGLGMTWDSPLHRYYKRALTTALAYGGSARLRQEFLTARGIAA